MDKQNTLGRSRLEEAIRQYECGWYDSLPTVQGELAYSARYRRRMAALLRKSAGSPSSVYAGLGKRAAAILLAAVLLMGSVVSVSGARHTFSGWITEVYERFTELFFEGRVILHAPDTVQTLLLPTVLPDGYTLYERYVADTEAKAVWRNKEGELLIFMQTTFGSKATVDHESTESQVFYASDMKFVTTVKKGMQCYYWNGEEYAYSLIASDTLDREVCMEIIFSVEEAR